MTAPVIAGGVGGVGQLGLGAAPIPISTALPAMSKSAQPYIAHLYDRNLVFKRTLGAASLLNKPGLKMTQNGGYQPITLELATPLGSDGNLTQNPSFEPSYLTGGWWNLYNNGPEAATIQDYGGTAGQPPIAGPNWIRVNWTVPNTSQKGIAGGATVGTLWKASTTYTVSFWARGFAGAVGQAMFLAWNVAPVNTIAVQNPPLTTSWQRYVFTITWGPTVEGSGPLFISVAGACAAGTLDLDLVQVVQGTVPAYQAMMLGDVIRLSEQGDNAGAILYSGNVETMPEEWSAQATHHQVVVTPWVAELGDSDFNMNYTVPTDVAQFVRDAVAGTGHCSVSPASCPNTGVLAIYNFQNATALDAVHIAKQIAGGRYWWFVDAQGLVWLQPVVTSSPATLTIRRADMSYRKPEQSVVGMRNRIPVIGGSLPGDTTRLLATQYDGATNQGLYGVRTMNPPPVYPTVTDQPTLNAIAASLGAQFDHVFHTAEIRCPALGLRLTPGRLGGLTVRYWEPAVEALQESGQGSGGYGPTLVVHDIEVDGPQQKLIVGDTPYADIDTAYEATRIAARISVSLPATPPTPPLVPQAVPLIISSLQTIVYGKISLGPYLGAMGGGQVALGSATFTTPRAGTCQVIGQLDCKALYWDNYIGTPRRAVWMDLPTIVTLAQQELGQSVRQTIGMDSGAGIAIAAGTYTLYWYINAREYNQIQVYSGWGQVVWIG